MKTVGIIAEYNPFHNGHLHQLSMAKQLSGADYAIIVMSGDFTQRGTPALLDKYRRAEMALRSGADLVLELPVRFATGSAECFARGAISLLCGLSVDALCFGSECGDVDSLRLAAALLTEEPERFRDTLRKKLRDGSSYPAARSQALSACLTEETGYARDIWQSPNNILGIEYLRALHALNSSMEVYTVKRSGSGYAEQTLPQSGFCSALAVRRELLSSREFSVLSPFLPPASLALLKTEAEKNTLLTENDFSAQLFYRLLSLRDTGYTAYADVSQALSDKISNQLFSFRSYSDFCTLLKSRDLTYARVSRALLHILLQLKSTEGYALYARPLGFRRDSRDVLSQLGKGRLPLLSKLSDAEKLLDEAGRTQLQEDLFASHLYESVCAAKKGSTPCHECCRQILII